jgi:hypothetical protein
MSEMTERELDRDEAVQLMRGGLAKALQDAAAQYVMPICWVYADGGRPCIPDSGSAFVLDCGGGPFLVTAAHVYDGFRQVRAEHPDTVCILDGLKIPLHERLIASDPAYDVATFRLRADEIEALRRDHRKVPLTGSQKTWPPAPPTIEKGVFFVGFPGDGRSMRPYRGRSVVEIDWDAYTALVTARGVSDTDITLVFDDGETYETGTFKPRPEDWALGGCSGAPLLTFVEQAGIFSWRLGGVIYEANSVILKASRADCLNSDGSINPFPNAMAYQKQGEQRR